MGLIRLLIGQKTDMLPAQNTLWGWYNAILNNQTSATFDLAKTEEEGGWQIEVNKNSYQEVTKNMLVNMYGLSEVTCPWANNGGEYNG